MQEAADLVWQHWQQRHAAGPPAGRRCGRPRAAEGYAVQARLEARSAAPLFGWKIAATSKAGQAHIAVDGPLAGRLLRERVFESGDEVPFGANHMRVAEAEFAFRMARDLAPRDAPYDVAEVLAAVEYAAPGHRGTRFPLQRLHHGRRAAAHRRQRLRATTSSSAPGSTADWRAIDLAAHPVAGEVVGPASRATASAPTCSAIRAWR